MSSPLATVTFEAPRSETAHAPPALDVNNTQYEPVAVKHPGG
jgi:hypothetical protein